MGNGQTEDDNWKYFIIFVGQTFKQDSIKRY